jgi:hypothetical protein
MYPAAVTLLIEMQETSEDLATYAGAARTDRMRVALWVGHMQVASAIDWFELGAVARANENLELARMLLMPLRTRASRRAIGRLEAIGRL